MGAIWDRPGLALQGSAPCMCASRPLRTPIGLLWHALPPQAVRESAPLQAAKAQVERKLGLRLPPAVPTPRRGAARRRPWRRAAAPKGGRAQATARSGKAALVPASAPRSPRCP